MQVIIGKNAGFCYGVKRAVETTINELENNKQEQIYCLGELVHNKQVIQKVESLGAKTIENIQDIPKGKNIKVVIRAHGVPPKTYKELKNNEYQVLDLTCPNVLAIHNVAKQASDEGRYVFLIGNKNHPEVIGISGCCKEVSVIEKEEDIEEAIKAYENSNMDKLQILSQTTFSLEKFKKYVKIIEEKLQDKKEKIEIKNTICNATQVRQEETENLAKQVQYMIIVGGKNSSNTKKLYEIAQKECPDTVCVETEKELNIDGIKHKKETFENENQEFKIGIMAGASTPNESILSILHLFN